jgi:hypothetical protein
VLFLTQSPGDYFKLVASLLFLVNPLVSVVGIIRGWGVLLTPTQLVIHASRPLAVPWSRVQAVEIDKVFLFRTVHIRTDDGWRQLLPAPRALVRPSWAGGDRFGTDSDRIRQSWLEHRGAGWEEQAFPRPAWQTQPGRSAALRTSPWVRPSASG